MGSQFSVLLEAASKGDVRTLEQVLENGGTRSVNTCDEDGWTALHYAASHDRKAAVNILLSHGADVNIADKNGETALHLATICGAAVVVHDLLSKQAAVDAADNDGMTALCAAAARGHTACATELLKGHANVNARLNNGRTPLQLAAWKGHVGMLQLLLEEHANVQAVDQDGRSALHLAADQGHVTVVKELLQANVNETTTDKDSATAADLAECKGHHIVTGLLRSRPSAPPLAVMTGSNTTTHAQQTASIPSSSSSQAASGISLPSQVTPQAGLHSNASNAGLQSAAATSHLFPYPTLFSGTNTDAASVEEPASSSASLYAQACEAVVGIGKAWAPQWFSSSSSNPAGAAASHSSTQHEQQQLHHTGRYGLSDNESEEEESTSTPQSAAEPPEAYFSARMLTEQLADLQLQGTPTPQPTPVAQLAPVPSCPLYSCAELLAACDRSDMNHQSSSNGQMSLGVLNGQPTMIRWLQLPTDRAQTYLGDRLNDASVLQHPHIVPVIGGSLEQGGAVVYDLTQYCTLEETLNGTHRMQLLLHQRVQLAIECCQALVYMQAKGLRYGGVDIASVVLRNQIPQLLCDPCLLHTGGDLAPTSLLNIRQSTSTIRDTPSFGLLILQLLTARHPRGLIDNVRLKLQGGELDVDTSCGLFEQQHAVELARIALRCSDDHPPDLADVILPRLETLMHAASTSYAYLTAQSASSQQASHSGSSASIPGTAGSRRPEAPTTHLSQLFKCPISHDIMEDPVIADDGETYDRSYIQQWFDLGKRSSPMTNVPLPSTKLIPNHRIRSAIQEWGKHHTLP